MRRFSAWWRGRAGGVVACLLLMFAFAPALDAVVCESDCGPAAHAVAGEAAHLGQAQGDQHHSDEPGLCVHGHCHQASSEAQAAPPIAAPHVDRQTYGLVLRLGRLSDRQFKLIRPPRA
jgi:hypothetical protein